MTSAGSQTPSAFPHARNQPLRGPVIHSSAISELEGQVQAVREELRANQVEFDEVRAANDAVENFQDEAVRRATVRGRIGLYLEATRAAGAAQAVADNRQDILRRIQVLERELDESGSGDRLDSILSRINSMIHDQAKNLDLEYSRSPIRLNLRSLTVVADSYDGPVPMSEMGSAANWMGYHIAVMLSLAEYFAMNNRPVPRFLILDQPSQVYFPPDATDNADLQDEDRAGLRRVLEAVVTVLQRVNPRLQVILLEHADLEDEWFQDAVLERWREGKALVPQEWL